MKKKLKSKLASLMAGLMAVSSLSGLMTIPTFADEMDIGTAAQSIVVNGFTLEREDTTSQWTIVDFDQSTTNAVMPDAVNADGTIIDNPDKAIADSVLYIDESVFDDLAGVETLKLPKYFSKIIKEDSSSDNTTSKILNKLTSLEAFDSNNDGNMFYVYDGALYAGTKLISYPQKKAGDYTIKEGTTYADERAFVNAHVGTLTIPDNFEVDNQRENNRYKYTFLATSVDYFEGANCKNGALFDGGRLIAYGNNSDADLSNVQTANPYAFHSEENLLNANLPEDIRKTIPFSFYSGENEGSEFQTRYFNIDGKTAYCYNHGKLNPEAVGNLSDYDETVSSDEVRHEVKAVLFAGYPNDAYGLLDSTGVDEEAAKNITGSLVWKAVDGKNFNLDEIYGIEDITAAEEYANALMEKVKTIADAEMDEFELKFYRAEESNVQGLVVINKVSKPIVPDEKPSVTISKQDITTKKELPGAKLTVTKDGVVIDEWVSTTEKHIIKDLEDGNYTLTETTAPDGYLVAESIDFTVVNGKVSVDEIIMYDAPEDTYIYISKQDATTKKELPGAELELTKDGVIIDSWTSTNEVHKIANPEDGTYVLTEKIAPNGYLIAESITFEVKDGKTSPNPIVMYDKAKKATDSDATPDKPIDGGYSGNDPEKPSKPDKSNDITIIPVIPDPVVPDVQPVTPDKNTEIIRKPIKTGDIMGTLETMLLLMAIGGGSAYFLSKRKKEE